METSMLTVPLLVNQVAQVNKSQKMISEIQSSCSLWMTKVSSLSRMKDIPAPRMKAKPSRLKLDQSKSKNLSILKPGCKFRESTPLTIYLLNIVKAHTRKLPQKARERTRNRNPRMKICSLKADSSPTEVALKAKYRRRKVQRLLRQLSKTRLMRQLWTQYVPAPTTTKRFQPSMVTHAQLKDLQMQLKTQASVI